METWSFSQQLIEFFSSMSGSFAYFSIFGVLFICGLGVPIPEDITLISAGILVSMGKIDFTGAVAIGFVGVMAGDSLLFFIGRACGRRVFSWPLIRIFATQERIARAEKNINENARFICFIARFFPGLRSVIFLTSGTMGVRPLLFFTLDGLAALISVPLWIYFGYIFGNNVDELLAAAQKVQIYLIAGVVVAIAGYIWWKVRKRPAL